MTSIIAGSGLGLFGSSLTQTHGYGASGKASVGQGPDAAYVNVSTGNLVINAADEFVSAIGLSDSLSRTYSSITNLEGYNLDHWQFSFERSLSLGITPNILFGNISRTTADGNVESFVYSASLNAGAGAWQSKDGSGTYDLIETVNSGSTLTGYKYIQGGTGVTENYDTNGTLLSTVDQNGNTLSYTRTGTQVTSISDSSGQTVTLTYGTGVAAFNLTGITVTALTPGATSSASTQTLIRVEYGYDTLNRLTSVTTELTPGNSNATFDSNVFTTTYQYDTASFRVTQIAQSDGTVANITYQLVGLEYRVATVTDGLGNQTSFNYNTTNDVTTVTDPLNNVTSYTYDATSNNLTQVSQPSVSGGIANTTYIYNADGNISQVTDAAGRTTYYTYDADGNNTEIQDSLGNTITRTFDASDRLSSQTIYQAPASAVGQAAGSPQTTNYLYDANENLRFVVSPLGEVTEYRYDIHGERITAIRYPAAQYTSTNFSTSALTTWAAGQDQTKIQRTDTTYDLTGQIQTVTAWNTTAATTGLGVNDGQQSQSRYVYDVHGRLLTAIDPRAALSVPTDTSANGQPYVTSYAYDGLNRVISVQNGLQQATTTAYNSNVITVTASNGLTSTSTYNAAGQLTSTVQTGHTGAALGTTSYAYDTDDRLLRVTDPTGQATYYVYDAEGRRTGVISPQKELTETVYNDDGQAIGVIQYATTVSSTLTDSNGNPLPLTISQVRPATSTLDRATRSYYDTAGRLIDIVDPLGYVTQYVYDGAGNRVSTTEYFTPLSSIPVSGNASDVTATASPGNDRTNRLFYDGDNRLVGTLDAAGYLIQTSYDNAGEVSKTIAYATATTSSLRASGTLAQLIPAADPVHDRVSYEFYDGQGRISEKLDAAYVQGANTYYYATANAYDTAGNLAQQKRYATALVYAGSGAPPAVVTSSSDQTQTSIYDALNRVVQQTDFQGTITRFNYDSVSGFLNSTVSANGQTDALGRSDQRTVTYSYDDLGRVINTLEGVAGSNTQSVYDLDGRKIESIDADGNKSFFYYDGDSRLVYTVNGAGEVSGNVYDAFGDVIQTTQYVSRISLTGLIGGLVSSDTAFSAAITATGFQANAANRVSTAQFRDDRGLQTGTVDAKGFVTTETYDAFGELSTKVSDVGATPGASSRTDTYSYDARGSVTQTVADSGGLALTQKVLQYDAFGRALRTQDPNGNITATAYDALGRVITVTDPLNQASTTTYDAFGRVLTQTDRTLATTTYTYSDGTQTVTVRDPLGITVTTVSNRHGQSIKLTDGTGASTIYSYDADGNLKTRTDADGNVTTDNYDSADLLKSVVDPTQVTTSYVYDAARRVLSRTVDPTGLNLLTQYAYTAFGQAYRVTDPNGVITETVFDNDGLTAAVIVDAAGLKLATTYIHDALGDTLTVVQGLQASGSTGNWTFAAAPNTLTKTTQYAFDKAGRRTSQTVDPSGLAIKTQYFYDADGNIVRQIDANGNTSRTVYDADNRIRYNIDPLGDVGQTDYDNEGRVTRTIQYAAPISVSSLSDSSKPFNVAALLPSSPNLNVDHVGWNVYDADGRAVFSVDAVGDVTGYSYDSASRVIDTTRYATRVATATLGLTPTAAQLGVVSSANDQNSRTIYDAAGRGVYTVDALNDVVQNNYDGNGNLILARAFNKPLATGTAYTKNALDTAIAASGFADNTRDRLTYTLYDHANRLIYTLNTLGTTVSGSNLLQTVYVTQTSYDGVGRVSDSYRYSTAMVLTVTPPMAPTAAAVATLVSANLSTLNDQHQHSVFDAAGRLSNFTDAQGYVQRYTYDGLGNKKTYTNQNNATSTYTYDSAGRLTEQDSQQVTTYVQSTTSSPAPTQITAASVTKFSYDGLGNVLTHTDGYTASGQSFTALRTTTYAYDQLGRQNATTQQAVPLYNSSADATAGYIGVHTTTTPLTSTVAFDAFGNAVTARDVGGNYSYKVYNTLNQLAYEIDVDGYVTGYQYDAFGNQTQVTRSANGITTGHAAGTAYTTSEVVSRLTASAADRTITTTYDLLDRKSNVIQPAIYTYDATSQTSATVSPITVSQYDAFGDLVQKSQLQSVVGATYNNAITYSYYDRLGNKTAQIDPAGYLTQYKYSATGQVLDEKEWASALTAGSYNVSSFTAPTLISASASEVETAPYYQSNFAQGTTGLSGTFGTNFTTSNGKLLVQDSYGQSANSTVLVQGTRTYTGSDTQKTVFTYNFSVGSGSATGAGRLFGVGNWNGSTIASSTFGIYLNIGPSSITVTQIDGGSQATFQSPGLGLTINANYQIQFVLDGHGASVELYAPGSLAAGRSPDFEYRFDVQNTPTSVASQIFASKSTTANPSEVPLYINSITESSYTIASASVSDLQSRQYSNVRETQFVYDRLGQLLTQTDVGTVVTTTASDGHEQATVGNVVTSRKTYDGVGNTLSTTDALGQTTLNFYNALGQEIDVVGPSRTFQPIPGATSVTANTLTAFTYDALGNQLSQTNYAYGTSRTAPQGSVIDQPAPTQSSATYDIVSYEFYDLLGRGYKSLDGNGNETDTSYDAYGNIVKTEQDYARLNGLATGHKVQIYVYNGRGLQVEQDQLLDPTEGSGLARHLTTYNAFGEVTDKGLAGGSQTSLDGTFEHYRYDNDGNLTGQANGVTTVILHDLLGNSTAQITSPSIDLSTYFVGNTTNSPAAVAALTTGVRRTETVYDADNRAINQRQASFIQAPFRLVPGSYSISVGTNSSTNKPTINASVATPVNAGGTLTLRLAPVGSSTWTTYTATGTTAGGAKSISLSADFSTMAAGAYQYQFIYTPANQPNSTSAASGTVVLAGTGMTGYVSATAVTMTVKTVNGLQYYVFAPASGSGVSLAGMTAVELDGYTGNAIYSVTNNGDGTYQVAVTDPQDIAYRFRPIGTAQNQFFTNGSYNTSVTATTNGQSLGLLTALFQGTLPISTLGSLATQLTLSAFQYKLAGTDSSEPYTSVPLNFNTSGQFPISDIFKGLVLKSDPNNFDYKLTLVNSSTGQPINLTGIIVNGQPLGDANGNVTGSYRYGGSFTEDAVPNVGTSVVIKPTSVNTLDRWGNVLSQTDADGLTTIYRYDDANRVIEQKKSSLAVFDDREYLHTVTPINETAYDAAGRVIAQTDGDGNLTSQTFDAAGEVISQTDGQGTITRYGYNAFGFNTSKTDPYQNVTSYYYDNVGELTGELDPAKTVKTLYAYDALGDRVNVNNQVTYAYDAYGNILSKVQPKDIDNVHSQSISYIYDSLGRIIRQTDNNSNTQTSTYDYFGRLLTSTGLTATSQTPTTSETYTYDFAGGKIKDILVQGGQTYERFYTYYDSGLLKSVYDAGTTVLAQATNTGYRETDYAYTAAGKLSHQRYFTAGNPGNLAGPALFEDTLYTYNTVGQLFGSYDNNAQLGYAYDAQGNKKVVISVYDDLNYGLNANNAPSIHTHNYVYDYDADNRVINSIDAEVVQGSPSSLNAPKAQFFQYDANGNRVVEIDLSQASLTFSGSLTAFDMMHALEAPQYQSAVIVNAFDADSRLVQTSNGSTGALTSKRIYNNLDQVTEYDIYSTAGALQNRQLSTYNADGTVAQVVSVPTSGSSATNAYAYDNAGNLNSVSITGATTGSYQYTYQLGYSGYQQTQIVANAYGSQNTSPERYDYRGNLIAAAAETFYVNNDGLVLQKNDNSGAGTQDFLFYQGTSLLGDWEYKYGATSPNNTVANLGYAFTPVSDAYPAVTPGTYVVNTGDTLQSIALAVYGDSSLWYVIGDANGLKLGDTLQQGQLLTLPNKVVNAHNNATTYQPYNVGKIVGNISPVLPSPPPPPRHSSSNGFASVLIAVVAIVASVYLGPEVGAAIDEVAGGSVFAAAGTTAVTASIATETVAGFALSGAVGSIASQVAANALGVSHGFSLTQVAAAALGGAATAGIGQAVPIASGGAASGFAQGLEEGALNSIANQGIGVALGTQSHFSWSSVAAQAVVGGAFGALNKIGNQPYDSSNPLNNAGPHEFSISRVLVQTGQNFASNIATQEISIALGGNGKIGLASVAADSFGNALGNSIAGAIQFQSEKASLGQAGQDQYEFQIGQGKSPDEALTIAEYADQQSLSNFAASGFKDNTSSFSNSGGGDVATVAANSASATSNVEAVNAQQTSIGTIPTSVFTGQSYQVAALDPSLGGTMADVPVTDSNSGSGLQPGFDDPIRASDAQFAQDVLSRSAEAHSSDPAAYRDDVRQLQELLVGGGLLPNEASSIDGGLGNATKAAAQHLIDAANIVNGDLGSLTPIFETSRAGVGTISSGIGDPGGISYGAYQLTTSRYQTMNLFLNSPQGSVFKDDYFGDLSPGTPKFNSIYTSVAQEAGDVLGEDQRAYVTQKNYQPLAASAQALGFDLSDRGVQEAIFSTSVQQGPYSKIPQNALDLNGGILPESPSDQIALLYRARSQFSPSFASTRYVPEQQTAQLISLFYQQAKNGQ